MKANNKKTGKEMETKSNYSISTFFDAIISSVIKVPTTIADDPTGNIKDAQ